MKELLDRLVNQLNGLGQGYYRYVEQVAAPIKVGFDATPLTTIRCKIIRGDTQEILFMKTFECNTITSHLDKCILMVQESLLSEVLKHSVFGVEGRVKQIENTRRKREEAEYYSWGFG